MTSQLKITKKYFLLLIDIKKSTSLVPTDRKKVFEELDLLLKKLNRKLNPKPVLKLSVSYGDEIAGLFETPKQFYEIVTHIREGLFPKAQFRFVAAHGRIGVASKDIRKLGGEVFKKADERIKQLKRRDLFCEWVFKNAKENEILNSLSEMSNEIVERMTPYQREVWQLLEQGLTQKEISKRLEKYPQSISYAVKRGGADQVIRAGQVISKILEKI